MMHGNRPAQTGRIISMAESFIEKMIPAYKTHDSFSFSLLPLALLWIFGLYFYSHGGVWDDQNIYMCILEWGDGIAIALVKPYGKPASPFVQRV
jgi:dolichol kinase